MWVIFWRETEHASWKAYNTPYSTEEGAKDRILRIGNNRYYYKVIYIGELSGSNSS